jgi:hypothetical protein
MAAGIEILAAGFASHAREEEGCLLGAVIDLILLPF